MTTSNIWDMIFKFSHLMILWNVFQLQNINVILGRARAWKPERIYLSDNQSLTLRDNMDIYSKDGSVHEQYNTADGF